MFLLVVPFLKICCVWRPQRRLLSESFNICLCINMLAQPSFYFIFCICTRSALGERSRGERGREGANPGDSILLRGNRRRFTRLRIKLIEEETLIDENLIRLDRLCVWFITKQMKRSDAIDFARFIKCTSVTIKSRNTLLLNSFPKTVHLHNQQVRIVHALETHNYEGS